MKTTSKTILAICLLAMGGMTKIANAQSIDTISFTWKVNAGVRHTFTPYTPPSEFFTVFWGDGTDTIYQTQPAWMQGQTELPTFCEKTYSTSGSYTVTIVGSLTCIISRFTTTSGGLYNRNITHIDVTKAKNLYHLKNTDDITVCIKGDYSNRFVPNGSISIAGNRLTLTQIDTIKPVTFPPHNPSI